MSKNDALIAKLLDIQSQAGIAITQDQYTAAGERALRAFPEILLALNATAQDQAKGGE